jgi:hypothetical protein
MVGGDALITRVSQIAGLDESANLALFEKLKVVRAALSKGSSENLLGI